MSILMDAAVAAAVALIAVAAGAVIAGGAILAVLRIARRPFARAAKADRMPDRPVARHRPTRDRPAPPMPRQNYYLVGAPALTVRIPIPRSNP